MFFNRSVLKPCLKRSVFKRRNVLEATRVELAAAGDRAGAACQAEELLRDRLHLVNAYTW